MNHLFNGTLRVGTSGIALAGNKESIPETYRLKSRLNYYSSLFETLEVNSSFYKIPQAATFEKWANDVPGNFQFTIKLSKQITHVKALNFELNHINHFLAAAGKLGKKKGCLLIQFPGKISLEYFTQVEKILASVSATDHEKAWRLAVELRNTSWYTSETFELLQEYNATMVLHDMPKSKNFLVQDEAPFYYFRFHGPKGDYRGSYSNEFLHDKSLIMRELVVNGKDVYAYFNNTAGNAYENARLLQSICTLQ